MNSPTKEKLLKLSFRRIVSFEPQIRVCHRAGMISIFFVPTIFQHIFNFFFSGISILYYLLALLWGLRKFKIMTLGIIQYLTVVMSEL